MRNRSAECKTFIRCFLKIEPGGNVSYCHACGKAIDADSYFCPFCGKSTQQPTDMETRPASTESRPVQYPYMPPPWYIGPERVSIGEVLSASWRIITQRPIIVIPHLVSVLVGVILGVSAAVSLFAFFSGASTEITPLAIVALLIVFVISTTIEGFYPLLVQRVVDGDDISLQEVASHALSRIGSLLGVAILIALLTYGVGSVAIGFGTALSEGTLVMAPIGLLIVIAGTLWIIYVMIWYFCAVPFLMLENRGVLDALSASKSFSLGKKWSIFGIIMVVAVFSILVEFLVSGIFPGSVETGLLLLVSLFFMVYNSILPSYLYLRYGTPRAAPPPPPAPVSPTPVSPMSAATTICPACGAEVGANQTYCGWCGSKLP